MPTLNSLPDDVWHRIVSHLGTDHHEADTVLADKVGADRTGGAGHRDRQACLCALSLVCKDIHKALLPLLYACPNIPNLAVFLRSTDTFDTPLTSFGKDVPPSRFALTHTLHLSLPDHTHADPAYITSYCSSLCEAISTFLSRSRPASPFRPGPIPNLHTITLERSPPADYRWSSFHLDIAGSPRQSIIALTQRYVFALIQRLKPKTIHQYTSTGPLGFSYLVLPFQPVFPLSLNESSTSSVGEYDALRTAKAALPPSSEGFASGTPEQIYIHRAISGAISYPLIRNSRNRWEICYDHGELATYNDQTESRLVLTLTLDVTGMTKRWREKGVQVGATKLEIVNLGAPLDVHREIWRKSSVYRRESAEKYPLPVAAASFNRRVAMDAEDMLAETIGVNGDAMRARDQAHREKCAKMFWEALEAMVRRDLVAQMKAEREIEGATRDLKSRISLMYS